MHHSGQVLANAAAQDELLVLTLVLCDFSQTLLRWEQLQLKKFYRICNNQRLNTSVVSMLGSDCFAKNSQKKLHPTLSMSECEGVWSSHLPFFQGIHRELRGFPHLQVSISMAKSRHCQSEESKDSPVVSLRIVEF